MESAQPRSTAQHLKLSRDAWMSARAAHRARMQPWAHGHVERASAAQKHPVYDFLFTYYSFRPAHLLRWSPGVNVLLCDTTPAELEWGDEFQVTGDGCSISAESFPHNRREYLSWALRYLTETANRPPTFHCAGLHEWAMLYREDRPRHSQVPLRLSSSAIAHVVESSELRCSHFDAYRFFTRAAVPRNRVALRRDITIEHDQPGCIHVTMDLYKFAHKIAPWCPSELIADAFLLAVSAREIDMRASPYDLREYGFTPLTIEEPSGRAEYVTAQRALSERARPIRERLIEIYGVLQGGLARPLRGCG